MNRIETHENLCDVLHQTYKNKNNDYGDSFAKVRAKYPLAILVRLNDKLNRLETLMTGTTQKISDESIDDTLLDLANYALMELVERHNDRAADNGTTNCPGTDACRCRMTAEGAAE